MKLNLAFFSSSGFVLPLLESIYKCQNQNFGQIVTTQWQWLIENQNQFSSILPEFWLKSELIKETQEQYSILWQKHINLQLIISQPDSLHRKKVVKNPIAQFALDYSLDLFQPEKINKEIDSFVQKVPELDAAIIASFGQILSQKVLETAKYGFVNWHPSKLPRYRGPSPMQSALKNDDPETTLSWIEMTREMDGGNIWLQLAFELLPTANFLSLSQRMVELGQKTWALILLAKIIKYS